MSDHLPTVTVDTFEGPFDVLLDLARQHKVDISEISLGDITDDFLAYIDTYDISPTATADFLVVAATLLLLKLKRVVPDLLPQEEEEISSLTDRLRVYQVYRTQAQELYATWGQSRLRPGPVRWQEQSHSLSISLKDLTQAWQRIQARRTVPPQPQRHLQPRRMSLPECRQLLTERLARVSATTFDELVPETDRYVRAVGFLTLLEMSRQGHIALGQGNLFDVIKIETP